MRRAAVVLSAVLLVALLIVGLRQAGAGDGARDRDVRGQFDLERAKRQLAGAPPELAALHGARAALVLARVGTAPRRCAAARRALGLSAAAPAEHRARLGADALVHLRTCEAPPR